MVREDVDVKSSLPKITGNQLREMLVFSYLEGYLSVVQIILTLGKQYVVDRGTVKKNNKEHPSRIC